MISPDFHRPHAEGVEPCPGCCPGWPVLCLCGGEIHAELIYSREGHGRLVQRCTRCKLAYLPAFTPAGGRRQP